MVAAIPERRELCPGARARCIARYGRMQFLLWGLRGRAEGCAAYYPKGGCTGKVQPVESTQCAGARKEGMRGMEPIAGLHHVTAIASDPQCNVDFYAGTLGMRLVKKTVNFDDPGTYHFYYGDDRGTPGTILTFFPWLGASRGAAGNGETSATAFRAAKSSLTYWERRLNETGVPAELIGERFGVPVLRFRDPDGMALEIAGVEESSAGASASRWSDVAPVHALRGFYGVTLNVGEKEPTEAVLHTLGLTETHTEGNRYRFTAPGAALGTIVDLLVDPAAPHAQLGAGSVHHIAFRVPDDAVQLAWREHLTAAEMYVTPVRDRNYFHSIYFREPGGVLFELATDPPGFTVDEPESSLGESLRLPAWLEDHRSVLEKALPPIHLPHQKHGVAHG